ncbi:MAG TPA: nuclear transport factor 2 family protein, partial [Candidimonas sp.]|nr:nuclear transport factor 2 family protein [Candidimonas sp.]
MSTQGANAAAQAEVKARAQSWAKAVVTGDVNTIMTYYAPDVLSFDAIQQLQFKGAEVYRKHWEACMAMCPGPMVFEFKDLAVEAEGNVAFAHA